MIGVSRWSFPLITTLYAFILRVIFVLTLTIPGSFAKEAFCSDKDFSRSIKNPTTFCVLSGAFRHYLYYVIQFWWLFSFGNLWWITIFPTRGHLLFTNKRKLHIMQSIVTWCVPIIGVIVGGTSYGYSQALTFPYSCYIRSASGFYYMLILPDQLFVGSCSTMLIWICYSLKKQVY
jgi:hypothetical protein